MNENKESDCNLHKHGAHAAVRELREGKAIDKRTTIGRYLKKTRENFIKDLGGKPNIAQQILLDRIMEKLLFLKIIGGYAREQGTEIIKDGRLIGCLGENYIGYDNALQRNIKMLYEFESRNKEVAREENDAGYLRAVMGKVKREEQSR